jgi:hypothetical protein
MASNAEIEGLIRDAHRRLSVVTTCVVSLSHSCRGKLVSVVAKADMKWFLNVWMFRGVHTMVVRFDQHEFTLLFGEKFFDCF